MVMHSERQGYWRNENGASAAEFALMVVPFLIMVFAVIGLSMMMYANQSLQYATEAAARCFAVDVTSCATAGDAQTYAANHYSGPNIAPVFTATTAGCGHTVTGSADLSLDVIVISITIPLSASACFP
jgi:Flp pilus assembly protein TadG